MNLIVPDSQRFGLLKPLLWINLLSIGSLIVFWTLGLLEIKPAQATLPDSEVANQQDIGQEKPSGDFQLSLNQADRLHKPGSELNQHPDPAPVSAQRVEHVSRRDTAGSTSLNSNPSVVALEPNAIAAKIDETLDQTVPARHEERQNNDNNPASIDRAKDSGTGRTEDVETRAYSNRIASPIPNPPIQASLSTQSGLLELALNSAHQPLAIEEEPFIPEFSSDHNCHDSTPCNQPLTTETSVRFRDTFEVKVAQLPTLFQNSSPLPVPTNSIPLGSTGSNSRQLPAFPTVVSPNVQPQGVNPYTQTWGQPSSFTQTPNTIPTAGTGAAMSPNSYTPTWGQSLSGTQTPTVIPMPNAGAAMGNNLYNQPGGQSSSFVTQTPNLIPMPGAGTAGVNPYNQPGGQPSYIVPTPNFIPVSTQGFPGGVNPYNPGGQVPYLPQTVILVPVQTMGMPLGGNPYNPGGGQVPYLPQTFILVPVQPMGVPMGGNPYNVGGGQVAYIPQMSQVGLTVPTQIPVGFNPYNPGGGQFSYLPQNQAVLPAPINPNPQNFNGYNSGSGQVSYLPQNQAVLPAPINPNSPNFNGYNPGGGQVSYLPQNQAVLPAPINPNPQNFNGYNPGSGQVSYLPQNQAVLPAPINPNSPNFNGYNPATGQVYVQPQTQAALPPMVNPTVNPSNGMNTVAQSPFGSPNPVVVPGTANPTLPPPIPSPPPTLRRPQSNPSSSLLRSTALRDPSLAFQGSYVVQGDSSVARARLAGVYPLTPKALFAATLDLTSEDSGLADSPNQGLNINELYFSTAPFTDLPNLRFVLGQLDLTSYFDRNSFAKDGVTHFFNPVFQTNPALSATGISSRPGVLVNWTLTDTIEAKAAAFSSSGSIGDFALDGFAGEVGLRYGNGIIRGTYATNRDAGSETGFNEIFSIARGDNNVGLEEDDREEAYGLNAEYFIPDWNMGIFGRYGRYINREIDEAATTYSFGVSFLDVFTQNDRLGLGYGQELSNNQGEEDPDVLELFYDFRFLSNLRLGFTIQQRNNFSETDVGVRLKTEFDVIPID
ncbi:hypothetical protein [Coleofasciculus chthonoplastes]|uniref:hypothetical protein n=1 Tax=Coleofasciculus chthonoplastes TaxID=64178 RepID=UPI0032F43BE3